ncbi:hypothetical protein I6F07_13740 [Ensifer sp. IC4062]|nr:hypothetical protein [Ensifer sp. IC4062]
MNFIQNGQLVSMANVERAIQEDAQRQVFRLECLPSYRALDDEEDLAAFRNGEPPNPSGMEGWNKVIKANSSRGVITQRVRLVTQPVSEYLRFEIIWGYRFSAPAGEDIRIIEEYQVAELRDVSGFLPDFWLIDDHEVYVLLYDFEGYHFGNLKVTGDAAVPFCKLRDAALSGSTRLADSPFWNIA